MNLNEYLESRGKGAAAAFAAQIGTSPVLISQWRTGQRSVPADRCPVIERETGGAVRCEELRPDVDWAYLRNNDRAETDGRQSLEGNEP
jgi:DNA-binding transcriptional regulator YdaS (Cro superfamily)